MFQLYFLLCTFALSLSLELHETSFIVICYITLQVSSFKFLLVFIHASMNFCVTVDDILQFKAWTCSYFSMTSCFVFHTIFLVIVDNKKKLHCDFFCLWRLTNKCYIVLHLVHPHRFYSPFVLNFFIYLWCYCGFFLFYSVASIFLSMVVKYDVVITTCFIYLLSFYCKTCCIHLIYCLFGSFPTQFHSCNQLKNLHLCMFSSTLTCM